MGANRDSLAADAFDANRASAASGDGQASSSSSLDSTLPPTPLRDLLAADGATIFVLSSDTELIHTVEQAGGERFPIRVVTSWTALVDAAARQRTYIVLIDADALHIPMSEAVTQLHEVAPLLVVLAAASGDAAQSLMSMLSDRSIHRLLIKPAAEGITRLLIDSAIGRYLQLRDEHDPVVLADEMKPARRYREKRGGRSPWLVASALAAAVIGAVIVGELYGVRWRAPLDGLIASAPGTDAGTDSRTQSRSDSRAADSRGDQGIEIDLTAEQLAAADASADQPPAAGARLASRAATLVPADLSIDNRLLTDSDTGTAARSSRDGSATPPDQSEALRGAQQARGEPSLTSGDAPASAPDADAAVAVDLRAAAPLDAGTPSSLDSRDPSPLAAGEPQIESASRSPIDPAVTSPTDPAVTSPTDPAATSPIDRAVTAPTDPVVTSARDSANTSPTDSAGASPADDPNVIDPARSPALAEARPESPQSSSEQPTDSPIYINERAAAPGPGSSDQPAAAEPSLDTSSPVQSELETRLALIDARLAEGRLLASEGDSAMTHYERAVALSPYDPRVLASRTAIAAGLVGAAELALELGDVDEAQRLAAEAFRLGAERLELARLDRELAAVQRVQTLERHTELLSVARAALEQERLLGPVGEGAIESLVALRRESSSLAGVSEAWREVTEAVAANVRAAIDAHDFVLARRWVATLAVDGGDPRLASELEFEARQAEFLATPVPASQLRLLDGPAPVFPVEARVAEVEGWVDLEFIVDRQGRTRDITVIESEPGSLFVEAAVDAVAQHRYAPFLLDRRVYERRVRVRVRFTLR